MSRSWGADAPRVPPYHAIRNLTDPRPRRRRTDAADVTFRLGIAAFVTWIYLRTLLVVAPGVDLATWTIFAYTGAPLLALVWGGAVWTFTSWARGAKCRS